MARFRLLADCWLDGVRFKHGAEIERPTNWRGPERTIPDTDPDTGHTLIRDGVAQRKNEPLYERIDQDKEDSHG